MVPSTRSEWRPERIRARGSPLRIPSTPPSCRPDRAHRAAETQDREFQRTRHPQPSHLGLRQAVPPKFPFLLACSAHRSGEGVPLASIDELAPAVTDYRRLASATECILDVWHPPCVLQPLHHTWVS